MFGLFGPKGWDALPHEVLREIRARLGDDFSQLNELAQAHGLFHQKFFKRPARDFLNVESEVNAFASLVGSLGNQLAQREKFQDARTAFELSLKLRPTNNPTAFSLANLHVMHGNLDEALPPAKSALQALWADDDFRESMDGRKMHIRLAKMLTEAELQAVLGKPLFRLAYEALGLYKERYGGTWSDEQRDRTVYASLEVGGPRHNEALREILDVTEDFWFDAAVALVARQSGANQNSGGGGASADRISEEVMGAVVFSSVVPLAIACTKLNPDHVDAWVLAARLRYTGAQAGYGYEDQAFHFALEALERIDQFLHGDNVITTKDPLLLEDGHVEKAREPLIEILRATRQFAPQQEIDRASPYLHDTSPT